MKTNIFYIFLLFAIFIGIVSCEEEDVLTKPAIHNFSLEMSADTVGSVATFNLDVEAEYLSFWNGMEKFDYYAIQDEVDPLIDVPITETPRMKIVNKGNSLDPSTTILSVTYKESGSFKAVLIATNVQDYTGELMQTLAEIDIVISE